MTDPAKRPSMLRHAHDVASQLGREVLRTIGAVSFLPLILAGIIGWALAFVGQFHELYILHTEQIVSGELAPTVLAVAALTLVSALLYVANRALGRHHVEQVFEEFHATVADPDLEGRVRFVGLLAVSLVWLGVASGIVAALDKARRHIENVTEAAQHFAGFNFGEPFNTLQTAIEKVLLLADKTVPAWVALFVLLLAIWLGRSLVRLLWPFLLSWLRRWRAAYDLTLRLFMVHWPEVARLGRGAVMAVAAVLVVGSIFVPFLLNWLDPAVERGRTTRCDPEALWRGWANVHGCSSELRTVHQLVPWALCTLAAAALCLTLVACWHRTRPSRVEGVALIITALSAAYAGYWMALGILGDLPAVGAAATALLLVGVCWMLWRLGAASTRVFGPFVYLLVTAVAILAFFLALISGLIEFGWVTVARAFGPLAMAITLGLVIVALVVALSHLGRAIGIPMWLVIVGVGSVVVANKTQSAFAPLVWIVPFLLSVALFLYERRSAASVAAGLALLSWLGYLTEQPQRPVASAPDGKPPAGSAHAGKPPAAKGPDLTAHFKSWLEPRKDAWTAAKRPPGQAARRMPVFIIAFEGGGIYASAAASAFLARMQARCPAFAQHVYAVSAVSGGAVGSLVFNSALDEDRHKPVGRDPHGCPGRQPQAPRDIEDKVSKVIKDDHLSPLAGLLVPDVLGTIRDRAWGLEQSLEQSMRMAFEPKSDPFWQKPFLEHAPPDRRAPSLVFNTTWVRVGNRVVFAPFEITGKGLVTLSSFAGLHGDNKWSVPQLNDVSVTAAAVTSARFPGVLPAYETQSTDGKRRWSFVDGGYVDASGANTAYEIFRTLKEKFAPAGDIDLRLILLTSSQVNRDLAGTEGRDLRDLSAPIVALFKVRALLSRIAVRETIAKFKAEDVETITGLGHAAQTKGEPDGWEVMTIELNQNDFQLELGWQISGSTYDIVSLQLGEAPLCEKAKPDIVAARKEVVGDRPGIRRTDDEKKSAALETAKTIRANSCVMAAMEKLLSR